MIKLDHPNIIKLYEVYETEEYFYLIMELCSGGELFERIITNIENGKPFTEEQAAMIFQQMMSAINYCHKNNIVHRDLKPENLLYLDQSQNSPIKVIDFGMSKICDPNDIMFERVGTAYYIAPEVLEGMYDEKCDVWSAGVILYILLCGYPCFNGETDEQIYRAIKKKKYDFPSPEWDIISDDAKNLIKKMLSDSFERISAEEVLKDPWVLNHAPNAKKGGAVQINEGQLKNYAASSKMRKAVLTYIASRLTQNEIEQLNKNFQEIDDNNDGKLTLEEIKTAVNKNKNINIEHIEEIFKSIDTDGSGCIEYTEFISASLDKSLYLKKEKLREAFNLFDVDNSGKISNNEIAKVLGMDKRSKEIHKVLDKYDKNKDGEIDFDEFFQMMEDLS
jgi:calcium-dependent protein kinase